MGVNTRLDVQITGADQLLKLQDFLDPANIRNATAGGIKYAASGGKTAVAKEIRAHYNIASARVKQDVGGPRFSQGGQVATLYLSRKPPSALQYGGKDTGKGLTMKVFKSEKPQRVTRGFIAKTGKLEGKPFRRISSQSRSEIAFVSGPSVGSVFAGDSRYGSQMQAVVNARINEQFIKGMQRALDSAARGYGNR